MKKGKIEIWWSVKDEDGKEILRKPANSWVIASLDLLYLHLAEAGSVTLNDINTVSRAPSNKYDFLKTSLGLAGVTTDGIVVGTGTNAVSLTDNKLQTPIAHGSGVGALNYGAMNYTLPYTLSGKRVYNHNRAFTNASGADITVQEVGLYCAGTSWKFCYERSLLNFTVTSGGTKTVSYNVSVTV